MTSSFKVASAQYQIGQPTQFSEFSEKITRLVDEAAAARARLLVFPEYCSMELAHLFPAEVQRSLKAQLEAMQSLIDQFHALFEGLARSRGLLIVAGSFPTREADGRYKNRSHLFGPGGDMGYQDKIQMTRFEQEVWHIDAGHELKTFDTPIGRIGINICYDSEFPMIARQQIEAGADLLVVPSCTDTLAGYWRVRIGCQARALENQCYVIQSPTVGSAPWSEAIDVNHGAAAVYTPIDYGFPDNGVLAIGTMDQPQWVIAEIDLDHVAAVRAQGQVFNHRDWPHQFRPLKLS